MKYAREYKRIARRMAEAAELEEAWKEVEEVYGKKAAKQLKELTPADPLLLHDLMVISHLNDGKTRKEVQELLISYKEKIGNMICPILHTQSNWQKKNI